jgi:hypothetical protein
VTDIDWDSAMVCYPTCWTCGERLPEGQEEGYCSDLCARTYRVFRWACTCGRFLSEENICMRNVLDPGAYYGVSTEEHYHCSRCGFRQGEARLVDIGSAVAPA